MSREEKIKEIFSQRMKGFAASMEELPQIIDVIKELKLEESIKYLLISKIEISSRFSEDLT